MFQKAGELSDQGFGEFDVCLAVLSTTKGNLQTAKKALSKLMFTQNKKGQGKSQRN